MGRRKRLCPICSKFFSLISDDLGGVMCKMPFCQNLYDNGQKKTIYNIFPSIFTNHLIYRLDEIQRKIDEERAAKRAEMEETQRIQQEIADRIRKKQVSTGSSMTNCNKLTKNLFMSFSTIFLMFFWDDITIFRNENIIYFFN